jgi:hypothetical protein
MKSFFVIALFFIALPIVSNAQVDYASQIQPIFNANCVSCHRGTSGVNLSNYNSVMSSVGNQYGKNIVIPGDATNSPLYNKLQPSPEHGSRMPNASGLSATNIELIRNWINEGAKETVTTSIETNDKPVEFKILGNFPNPFNPTTVIEYQVAETSTITLSVVNTTGNLILSETVSASAGQHSFSVNLSNYATGLYLYRITAQSVTGKTFSATQKMMLIK